MAPDRTNLETRDVPTKKIDIDEDYKGSKFPIVAMVAQKILVWSIMGTYLAFLT